MKLLFLMIFSILISGWVHSKVRLKDVARFEGNRDIPLVGYGLVVGLSGSGDSSRNKATVQSLMNSLNQFGLKVDERDLSARNVAAVIITGVLPAYSSEGDKIDIRVASTGDARSLSGGSLMLAPLYGPDKKLYALGQGALTVGGYQVESFSNVTRKNQTTVGLIAGGASIERVSPMFLDLSEEVSIILNEPDYTTMDRVVNEIKNAHKSAKTKIIHPGKVIVEVPAGVSPMRFVASLENLSVNPDLNARVVVNEKTGTIVAGTDVEIGDVSIAHGNLRIQIETKFDVSQPQFVRGFNSDIQTTVVPDTKITVTESSVKPLTIKGGSTVGDLVQALFKLKVSTRETISILESIKAAGALHADLIIQ